MPRDIHWPCFVRVARDKSLARILSETFLCGQHRLNPLLSPQCSFGVGPHELACACVRPEVPQRRDSLFQSALGSSRVGLIRLATEPER